MEDASELQMLRSRLVRFALEQRRGIERALHDGDPAVDLIGLSMRLQLVRNLMATDPENALSSLDQARGELRVALDRVRVLASDIYPAVLDVRGLPDALRQTARASGAVASVQTAGLGRYPGEVEAAVAFLWRAALEGLGSEADAGIRVWEEGEELRVIIEAGTVVDLVLLDDFVQSVGGTVKIRSGPNRCRIEAGFPVAD